MSAAKREILAECPSSVNPFALTECQSLAGNHWTLADDTAVFASLLEDEDVAACNASSTICIIQKHQSLLQFSYTIIAITISYNIRSIRNPAHINTYTRSISFFIGCSFLL